MNHPQPNEAILGGGSRTPGGAPRVLVAIPTLGRRDLHTLLACLHDQAGPVGAHLLLIHNAPHEDAALRALAMHHDAMYVHVAELGFSSVRNAALEAARGYDILCFIDDDELPQEGWLRAHVDGLFRWEADILLGPVDVTTPADAPAWLDEGRLLRETQDRPEGRTGGPVYSGNTSMRVAFIIGHGLRFDPRFNVTGGEDTEFFSRCRSHGAVIAWSRQARVTETPDQERLTIRWMMARNYMSARRDAVRRVHADREPRLRIAVRKFGQLARGLCRFALGVAARRPPTWARGLRDLANAVGTFRGLAAAGSPPPCQGGGPSACRATAG